MGNIVVGERTREGRENMELEDMKNNVGERTKEGRENIEERRYREREGRKEYREHG